MARNKTSGEMSRKIMERIRLGDKIERAAKFIGIKACAGCKRRKAWLNGDKHIPDMRTIKG